MKYTKKQLFEASLALNGDDKKYIITVEDDKIITRVKWMDATLFSPTSISKQMEEFEYIVKVNDNGTYSEITKLSSKGGSLSPRGGILNKETVIGGRARKKTIAFGKDNQTGEVGVIDASFSSEEYKHPIKELLKSAGYKKKISPVAIGAIAFSISASLFVLAVAVLMSIPLFGREPIDAEKFESSAVSSGYSVQIDNDFGEKFDSVDNAFVAKDEEDDYQITYLVINSSDNAKEIFSSYKTDLEKIKSENAKNNHSSSTSSAKYEKYKLLTKDHFLYIARIENTIILINAGVEDKAEAESFIKEIGY